MKIESVTLRSIKIPLNEPFTPSFGSITYKDLLIVEVHTNSATGYGDDPALSLPIYNEETVASGELVLKEFLLPLLKRNLKTVDDPFDVAKVFKSVRRNYFARSAIETAIFDAYAKSVHKPLYQLLGGNKDRIEGGISIGIKKTPQELIDTIKSYQKNGYRRIKVKIKPGFDLEYIKAVRNEFPEIELQVDANSAYTLDDIDLFEKLDNYDLALIEQPLGCEDIIDHAALQKKLKTPICLDESIDSLDDARQAIDIGALKIINIKVSRVGGLANAKAIHDYAKEHGVGVWCGSMLESGIGQAHNLAIASLENYRYSNDIMSSTCYLSDDIIKPQIEIGKDSFITIPEREGIGYDIDEEKLQKYTFKLEHFDF